MATTKLRYFNETRQWSVIDYTDINNPFVTPQQFGALANGVADDSAAIQAAINSFAVKNGGVVFFPPGVYKVSSGISVTTACRLVGSGQQNTEITCAGADITPLTLNAFGATVEHMIIVGKGASGDTFGANHPALECGANFVNGLVFDVEVLFGSSAIRIDAGDARFIDVSAANGYGDLVENLGGGSWFINCKFDQNWPTGTPPSGMASAVPAWAGTTPYLANQLVSTGGYLLQCLTGGTSAGVAPTLKNYFVDIPDGTVTWRLASPANYTGMVVTGVGSQSTLEMCDFTGCYMQCILISGAIANLLISQCYFGLQLQSAIQTNAAGQGLIVDDCDLFGSIFTSTGSSIDLGASWTGITNIRGNMFHVGAFSSKWGVLLGGGTLTSIANNIFTGGDQSVEVSPNVTHFVITGNLMTSTNSIKVNAGTSDFYNIVNNIVNGAAVSDGGSGVNKTISGNN